MSERIKLSTGLHPEQTPPSERPEYRPDSVVDHLRQVSYEEGRRTRDSLHGLIEAGKLGMSHPDLDLRVNATRPELPTERSSMGLSFGSASPRVQEMVLAEREARKARGIIDPPLEGEASARRHIVIEDNANLVDVTAGINTNAPNRESLTAQHEAYMREKATRTATDNARLASLPPDFVTTGVERYGRDGLLSILNAEQTLQGHKGPDSEVASLTHAGTGESISLGEAQRRIDADVTKRLGNKLNHIADMVDLRGSEHASRIDMGGTELAAYETQLSPDVKLTAISDPLEPGKLGIVELTVSTPQEDDTSESHDIAVTDPADAPEAFIDGQPATTADEKALVEAVVAEAERIIRDAAEPAVPEAVEDVTPQIDGEQPAVVASAEATPVIEPEEPTQPEAPVSQERAPTPPQPAERREPTQEEKERDAQRKAAKFATDYLGGRGNGPQTRAILEKKGFNISNLEEKFRNGTATVSRELLVEMDAFRKEVSPESSIWSWGPGASTAQRTADECRRRLNDILNKL